MAPVAMIALEAQPLTRADNRRLTEWLDAEALPSGDLDEVGVRLFAFRDGEATIGFAGLEIYGFDALLRSVVVDPASRRGGWGRAIVEAALAEALRLGSTRAFLLTTAAKAYFERLGFASIARASAPEAIFFLTRQAAGLCPSSAALMVKALV